MVARNRLLGDASARSASARASSSCLLLDLALADISHHSDDLAGWRRASPDA